MNFYARRFNLYLLLSVVSLAAVCGCSTFHKKNKNEKISALRVHIETTESVTGQSQAIHILRSEPVVVIVSEDPVLTEQNVIAATLLETPGGFAVRIRFDEIGAWTLEQYTAANPGKHLVIFGQWGKTIAEGRWIAAPLITHRIGDGTLTFTPDASRAESARFVEGLNNVAKMINTKKK